MEYIQDGVIYNRDAEDIARIFGRHVTTIRVYAKEKKIPHIRLGVSYLFNEDQVRAALVKPVLPNSAIEDYSDIDDV